MLQWQHSCWLSQPDQGFKRTILSVYFFISRPTYKFLEMQYFPCTQQVPHLHSKENVPAFFIREGTFISVSWEATVCLYRWKSLIKGRECQPVLPRKLPQSLLPCPFWKEGQTFIFPASRMLASDCSNSDVPKSKPTLHKRPETSQQDTWILKGVQRTSMLILERARELENRDKLSERRIAWYFWLKCWFLPSRKALTMYPSLIRWDRLTIYTLPASSLHIFLWILMKPSRSCY